MITAAMPPKAPRWIATDAGHWAWQELEDWRDRAGRALSVDERARLLDEAERLRGTERAPESRHVRAGEAS